MLRRNTFFLLKTSLINLFKLMQKGRQVLNMCFLNGNFSHQHQPDSHTTSLQIKFKSVAEPGKRNLGDHCFRILHHMIAAYSLSILWFELDLLHLHLLIRFFHCVYLNFSILDIFTQAGTLTYPLSMQRSQIFSQWIYI